MRGCTPGQGDFEDWLCQVREAPNDAAVTDQPATNGDAGISGGAVLLLLAAGLGIGGGLVAFVVLRSGHPSRHKRRNYREGYDDDALGTEMQQPTDNLRNSNDRL